MPQMSCYKMLCHKCYKNNEHLKMAFRKNLNFTGGGIKFSGLIKSKKFFKCCVSHKMSLPSFVSRRFRPF